jgi:hypothetical protein
VQVTRETLGLAPVGRDRARRSRARLAVSCRSAFAAVGLPDALRALRGPALGSALAAMALCGWPLGLLLRVSAPEVLEGQKVVNDAAYLVEQSGPLLWVFAVLGLARFASSPAPSSGRRGRYAALRDARDLAVRRQEGHYRPGPHAGADGARDGRARHRFEPGATSCSSGPADAGRRRPWCSPAGGVSYERFTPYLTQFVSKADLEARHETVFRFFRTEDPAEAIQIARSLGASYLALYGSDRVRFDTAGLLESVYEEEGARVYRIVGTN